MRYVLVAVLLVSLVSLAIPKFQQVLDWQAQEAICLKELTDAGVERIDIRAHEGKCVVHTNAYYTN